jgi:precorrin-6B methylase 2
MLREHLADGSTFVEVGAKIGAYALQAAAVVGAAGHVIAVEQTRKP